MPNSPAISAVICTYNRGDRVVVAIQSILRNTHPDFELILVDQSENHDTEQAITAFLLDPRFHYIPSATHGLGASRNIGLEHARAEIVAFTDDDCSVPPNWLSVIERIFAQHLRVSVIFSSVKAGPHDQISGFIPTYTCRKNKIVRNICDKCLARGIGASMAVRHDPITRMGGFDEMLGAGSFFHSCEDADIAIRAIVTGQWVYETNDVVVTHYGFRSWYEGRALAQRDWTGIGAAYIKPLRAGYMSTLLLIFYELLGPCMLDPLKPILKLRRPRGFGRMIAFLRGIVGGMRQPMDRKNLTYR